MHPIRVYAPGNASHGRSRPRPLPAAPAPGAAPAGPLRLPELARPAYRPRERSRRVAYRNRARTIFTQMARHPGRRARQADSGDRFTVPAAYSGRNACHPFFVFFFAYRVAPGTDLIEIGHELRLGGQGPVGVA